MDYVKDNKVHLTKREKECLHLLVYGMTAKQIAKELGIAYRTVESYINTIKVKMGCFSRSQLIAKVLKEYAKVTLCL